MELRKIFDLGEFDLLRNEQYEFLISFLKNRGNLKDVQTEMQISYPTAKKKLDDLLDALNLGSEKNNTEQTRERIVDMRNMIVDYSSNLASEIIKAKLKENGGYAKVFTARGLPCEIYAEANGSYIGSNKLPNAEGLYDFEIFDDIVDLLIRKGGRARKGNGRNFKLGEPGCEEDTVVGVSALHLGKRPGESVFDPVFVFAAVLEWAGIAENGRGELVLMDEYVKRLRKK